MQITKDQQTKAVKKLESLMLAARRAFIAAHPDYSDKKLDPDDMRYLASLASGPSDGKLTLADTTAKAIEAKRLEYVLAGRDTSTIDIITTRTEKGVVEGDKYKMLPWLAVKRYALDGTVYRIGYQSPEHMDVETPNHFLTAEGDNFQVLRSKSVFQILDEDGIKALAESIAVDFELYFSLFY